jgi:plasmid stabilization system protein ParE
VTAIKWSPQAIRDVESIRDYIAQDSPRYAELTVGRILASVERLHAFPQSGRVVPERGNPEIREVIVGPFRVVYRYRVGVVEIATVFRASRLFPTLQ